MAYMPQIGQLQLIRKNIANQLNLSSKFEAKFLYSALITFNNALLNDVNKHVISPQVCPYPALINAPNNTDDIVDPTDNDINNTGDPEIDIIHHMNKLLHSAGLHDPISQIYITTHKFRFASVYPCLLLTSVLNKLTYSKTAGIIVNVSAMSNMMVASFQMP